MRPGATDEQGRFNFEKIGIPLRHDSQIKQLLANNGGARLLAWADGRAIAWAEVKSLAQNRPVRFVLAPEVNVTGRAHDKTGVGIEGVKVLLAGITPATSDIDQSFLKEEDLRLYFMESSPDGVLTNKDGQFTLHHLPADRRIMVSFTKPGLRWKPIFIDTSNDRNLKEIPSRPGRNDPPIPVQHSPLDVDSSRDCLPMFVFSIMLQPSLNRTHSNDSYR